MESNVFEGMTDEEVYRANCEMLEKIIFRFARKLLQEDARTMDDFTLKQYVKQFVENQ